ncbi:MAG: HD-GYP domain-containing protein [Armatimonadetes bacterium]|nr:HD-GYP domain-containing protein [Armatimonadota bacterium]
MNRNLSDDVTQSIAPEIRESDATTDAALGMLNLRSAKLGAPDGHSERVASYAVAMGKQLDLNDKMLRSLQRAAVLHDIGKVGISSSIVDKLGRLTDREFEIMRLHSTIAIRMLEQVNGLEDALPMIKHHHERFDGKGYPDGLAGHEIPLGARIIAVAETFDILVSDVPWREALPLNSAVQEVRDNSGTQFDPIIVDAFLTALNANAIPISGQAAGNRDEPLEHGRPN